MNDFNDLCLKRESCRAYNGEPVSAELLNEIVQTAMLAPSARNRQPWKFHICTGETAKRIFAEAMIPYGWNTWSVNCPALIAVESDVRETERLGKTYEWPMVDCGIVLAHLTLAAAEKGLGTCIIGAEDEEKVKEILGVPAEKRVWCTVSVGWPAEPGVREKQRKTFEETVCYHG